MAPPPILTNPDATSLLSNMSIESNSFTSILEDPSLPTAIKSMISIADRAQGTNEAPSLLLTIQKIPGTAKVGAVSNAIEAYGYYLAARKKVLVGSNGQLQTSSHVIVYDLLVVCPDDSFVETCLQAIANGENIGNVSLYSLRNIGTTAQTDFQIDLTNARFSAVHEGNVVTVLSMGFDTITITYCPVGDDAKASGQVPAFFNLTTNSSKSS